MNKGMHRVVWRVTSQTEASCKEVTDLCVEHDSVLVTHRATQIVEEPLGNLGDQGKAFRRVL
jgi:hypothetical protein